MNEFTAKNGLQYYQYYVICLLLCWLQHVVNCR